MGFSPVTAAIRFGTGLSPDVPAPASVARMMDALTGPDRAAERFPIPFATEAEPTMATFEALRQTARENRGTAEAEAAIADSRALRRSVRDVMSGFAQAHVARAVTTGDGLRERLAWFWADHFTVRADVQHRRHLVSPYIEEAIRPHVAGRFADMLVAVATHPMMLLYLDQHRSVGPASRLGQRRGRGLNENLAREVLELHTLGVGGPYTQADVRQLAELFTGLSLNFREGRFRFVRRAAEPGAETVLGRSYGGDDDAELADIERALGDLARHPATARHIARKLAVHFVADAPDDRLIGTVAAAYLATDGDLARTTEALLTHPAAWGPARKVKQPFGFIVSALRALAVPPERILAMDRREMNRGFYRPLRVMGQGWQAPPGPDGWPEAESNWVTPQGMAGRITWAMTAPAAVLETLPDPRDFVITALGPEATGGLRFAASAAETVADGIGLVLASADFQRR